MALILFSNSLFYPYIIILFKLEMVHNIKKKFYRIIRSYKSKTTIFKRKTGILGKNMYNIQEDIKLNEKGYEKTNKKEKTQ